MIKKLRIKFICVIMAIVTVLLGTILGVVIHFTAQNMEMQSISMMQAAASAPMQQGIPGKSADGELRLPVITVQLNSRGELISASGGYFDLTDRDDISQIVDAALSSGEESGVLKQYSLRYLISPSPRGDTLVFSDTSTEEAMLKTMVYSFLAVFLAALLVFLAISILLSRWVIRPVEKAWEQQRQFVADASHELKTPLAVIMANAELMHGDGIPDAERKNFSETILSTTYQMRSLVENMLEMARVDNSNGKLPSADLDLSQLVQDAVLSFQLLYAEQGMGLQYTAEEGIHIHGSEQHLYQVMDVLLDNALKYSTPGSTVEVSLTRNAKNCTFCVASPGTAISKEDLKNIFKRFYRADKARAMNGSYGLGLSIAESIVHSHRGKIWAQSENGVNAFFVQLPQT